MSVDSSCCEREQKTLLRREALCRLDALEVSAASLQAKLLLLLGGGNEDTRKRIGSAAYSRNATEDTGRHSSLAAQPMESTRRLESRSISDNRAARPENEEKKRKVNDVSPENCTSGANGKISSDGDPYEWPQAPRRASAEERLASFEAEMAFDAHVAARAAVAICSESIFLRMNNNAPPSPGKKGPTDQRMLECQAASPITHSPAAEMNELQRISRMSLSRLMECHDDELSIVKDEADDTDSTVSSVEVVVEEEVSRSASDRHVANTKSQLL
jgi:hypothetical protein